MTIGVHLRCEEFDLRGVEQGFVVGHAHDHAVELLQAFNDVGENPLGQGHGDIATHHVGEGGPDIAFFNALPGAAPAALQVAEALKNGFAATDQAGQLADGFAVGLVVGDRLGEHHFGQKSEIGVFRLFLLVGMAVDAHEAAVILQGHIAALVGAEGARLVVVLGRLDEEGGVVDHAAQVLEDIVVHLHPHTHLDAALAHPQVELGGQPPHPVGPGPSGGQNHVRRAVGFAVCGHALHPCIFHIHLAHILGGVDHHPPGAQVLGHVDDIPGQPIAAQVFLLDDQQVDAVALGAFAKRPGHVHVGGINRPVHTETVENLLGLLDQFPGRCLGHELGQVGFAQLLDIVEFPVGKKARAAEAAKHVARFAALAVDRGEQHGALPTLRGLALVHQEHLQIPMLAQVISGKKPRRSAADNDHIEISGTGWIGGSVRACTHRHLSPLARDAPDVGGCAGYCPAGALTFLASSATRRPSLRAFSLTPLSGAPTQATP